MIQYPYPVPNQYRVIRSALLDAGSTPVHLKMQRGYRYRLQIFDLKNRVVVFESAEVADYRELAGPFSVDREGYVLRLVVILRTGSPKWTLFAFRAPSSYLAMKVSPSFPYGKGLRLNVSYASGLPSLVAKAKRSAYMAVKQSRRPFVHKSSVRPSPEVRTGTVPLFHMDGPTITNISVSPPFTTYSRTWTGTRTPNFAKLKDWHQLPVNGHSVSMLVEFDDYGLWDEQIRTLNPALSSISLSKFPTGTTWGPSLPNPSHDVKASNKAVKRLIGRSNSAIDANLAQDTAQLGQTVRVIGDAATRIAKSFTALKRGNIPLAVKSLWQSRSPLYNPRFRPKPGRNLADNWLALQYGWKPLLQDVHGSMSSLANYNLGAAAVQRMSASGSQDSLSVTDSRRATGWEVAGKCLIYSRTTCKYTIRYRVGNHLQAFLAQTGFSNPINLAWEVLPYSFVVDWLLPVGPYLETLTAWNGLVFLDGVKTQFTRQVIWYDVAWSGHNKLAAADSYTTSAGGLFRHWILLDRVKLTAFPTLTQPSLKNPLSTEHALNALALLRSAFRR